MPLARPVLIYDGRCGFCKIWINYWPQLTGERIEYIASQDALGRFPQIPSEAYAEAVQLVRMDGSVASGARAVFESLNLLWVYGLIGPPSELAYRFIAQRRNLFYTLTKYSFGTRVEPSRFDDTQWIFLRALGAIYAVAFASLAVQVTGLIGLQGILPAGEFLTSVMRQLPGIVRYLAVPSIFWLGVDDRTLTGMAWMGAVLAVMLVITGFVRRRFERLILILLFVLYLSFSAIGQDFLSFQWDSLLIEAGFLAIFLGRNRIVPWLFRWLVFRFYFLSGAVKLLSGDRTWRSLTALEYHYHTQPLPTAAAWFADKLPANFQRGSTFMVLAIELAVPFLIWFPRRIRMMAAWWMIALQILIFITGNYTFFNLLTIALCLFLFDDQALSRFVPAHQRASTTTTGTEPRAGASGSSDAMQHPGAARTKPVLTWALAVVIVGLGIAQFLRTFRGSVPEPLQTALRYTAPLQIVNTYGLFAVMTTVRNEIVIEGSNDGEHWMPYRLPYKPQNVNEAPRWAAPYQPRLDWQMWFAALGNYENNPWFVGLSIRLLQGSPAVAGLFSEIPFEKTPPRYIRATVFEYNFSDWNTLRRTGAWWVRAPRGLYLPAVTLRGQPQNSQAGQTGTENRQNTGKNPGQTGR